MPTYHARGISVHLGTMPLDQTVTPRVVLRKGDVAKQQCEEAEKQLRGSRKLDERNVPLPGDATGFQLHWLEDVPFMQVQVGTGSDDTAAPQLSATHGIAQTNALESSISRALVLHVDLSNKTFTSGFEGKTHLKIDVLFNGQLSGCTLINTNDIRCGTKSLDQIFAGSRVDYLAERPWVILPPRTSLNDKSKCPHKIMSADKRWDQINQALLSEAVERGTNKLGDLPPTAKLLVSMTRTQMPVEVGYMQSPGGKLFGVVDVIISAGTGKKVTSGTSYLSRPERLRDEKFPLKAGATFLQQAEWDDTKEARNGRTKEPLDSYHGWDAIEEDEEEAEGSGHSDYYPTSPKRRATSSKLVSHDCTRPFPTLHNPFTDDYGPLLPPSEHYTPHTSHSWTVPSFNSANMLSPFSKGERSSSQSLSPTYNHATTGGQCETQQDRSSGNSGGYGSYGMSGYYSSPMCTPQVYHSSRHLWHSDPVTEPRRSIEHMPLVSYDEMRSFSNRVLQVAPTYPPFPQMQITSPPSHAEMIDSLPRTSSHGVPKFSMYPDEKERRHSTDLTGSYFGSSTRRSSSLYGYGPSPVSSSLDTIMFPSSFASVSPHALLPYKITNTRLPGRKLTYPPIDSDCKSKALPPTGLFTIPQKPRSGVSSSISQPGKVDKLRSGIAVSRLVITGTDGVTIVDHSWASPQRVLLPRSTAKCSRQEEVTIVHHSSRNDTSQPQSMDICPLPEAILAMHVLSNAFVASHADDQNARPERETNRKSSNTTAAMPYLRKHHSGSVGITIKGKLTKTTNNVPTSLLAETEQMKTPQSFKINRTGILGVQGPKAVTYLLDDPEFSREAARLRKSMSPTKPIVSQASQSPPRASLSAPNRFKYCKTVFSSPLSSVPPFPERYNVPQLDGSSRRRKDIPSPSKQQTHSHVPPMPQVSAPLDSKKRKTVFQSPIKKQRKFKSHCTMDNPPLNQNCVIALAEGVCPSTKQGVLRQVKGERQGVFEEGYVMLAVRFYIPGN